MWNLGAFSRHFASRLLFDLGACHGQLRTDSYLGAQSSKFGFSGGDFHHGHGRFYDDRQSARRFGKTTKFVGNCGDVMRCPVNLDLNNLNYQRLTIFATSTHKDRLLHDSDFVFKISAIGVVFFQDTDSTHWFDPVELQELMDRSAMFLGSESCGLPC